MKKIFLFSALTLILLILIFHDSFLRVFLKTSFFEYQILGNVTPFKPENRTVRVGISTEPTLNFGVLPQGFLARKRLNLTNHETLPAKFRVEVLGRVRSLVSVSESEFILSPNETKILEIAFNASKLGNYTGKLRIWVRVPKAQSLNFLLGII